jgi:DNA-binding transcriptional LysR family regulator
MLTITQRQLQYVIAVAEAGSIVKAAETMFISRSGLSEAIKELELGLGFKVFRRSSLGVIATKEGEKFIQRVNPVLKEIELIEKDFIE